MFPVRWLRLFHFLFIAMTNAAFARIAASRIDELVDAGGRVCGLIASFPPPAVLSPPSPRHATVAVLAPPSAVALG
ncbi:hypothetical protein LJR230_000065 [Trinickia sp. LjRoot230]|uniref:hypothetical protein n=1 Tax=Trinickia sp. LjRoot230 TaxID=3342288 RepID=UPI003ECDB30C